MELAALLGGGDLETSRTREQTQGTEVLDQEHNYQEEFIADVNRRAALNNFGEFGLSISRPFPLKIGNLDFILMPGGYIGLRAGMEEIITNTVRDSQLQQNGMPVGDIHRVVDEQNDSALILQPIPGLSLEACGELGSLVDLLCIGARVNYNTSMGEPSYQLRIGGDL